MTDKPTEITSPDDLKYYYWMKSDLMMFCKKQGLSTRGAKSDLMERIRVYLSTGHRIEYKPKRKQGESDSLKCITRDTPVKNYKNDAETRRFFVKHIGKKFKFNAYLRQFTNPANVLPNMTYGDLIEGWASFENSRKNSNEPVISPQFEYNKFIKDFFSHEKGATLSNAISAWKILISKKGSRTYEKFKLLNLANNINQEK